jgi:uncharacterized protein with NRDE domain
VCLILFSYKTHPAFDLILAANRDEFYDRPTAPLDFFPDHPHILGGRDLKGNGTWLGVTREGRIAAITNFRDPLSLRESAPSRGEIVNAFLTGTEPPHLFLEKLHEESHRYNGFNLIVGTMGTLYYYSNREGVIRVIPKGLHGLSNHLLNTPWPKVSNGKTALLEQTRLDKERIEPEALFEVLSDQTRPPDAALPDTRVGMEWERVLSPIFIQSPGYGTRSSAILLIETGGRVTFIERTFLPEENRGNKERISSTRRISFKLPSRP